MIIKHYFLYFLILGCLFHMAFGQTLVKDINSDTTSTFEEFEDPQFVYLTSKSLLFFVADDGVHGKELWKTGGTPSTTAIVKDIKPFDDANGNSSEPRYLTVFNGLLYFFANDGKRNGLWKSDGTEAGTVCIKDLDFSARTAEELIVAGGKLYFYHAGPTLELWSSDGTTNNTAKFMDNFVNIYKLVSMGNSFFFFGQADGAEAGLWRSDGTVPGTFLIKPMSEIYDMKAIDSVLYFAADEDGSTDIELWRSEGSTVTTRKIKDINTMGSSFPKELTVFGKMLFFSADDGVNGRELWRSKGEEETTVIVADIYEGGNATPTYLVPSTNYLFFTANDGSGVKLYKTDGTTQGTLKISPKSGLMEDPGYLCAVGTTVYFVANDPANGFELWKTDGTQSNTAIVQNIYAGTGNSNPRFLANINGTLYFTAQDGSMMTRANKVGREIWKSQGTITTTTMVADINTASADAFNSHFNNSNLLASVGTVLYFVADDGDGNQLWRSDGTALNTKKITTGSFNFHTLIGTSSTMFVLVYDAPDYLLYKVNATATNIEKVGGVDVSVKVTGDVAQIGVSGSNLYYQRADNNQVFVTAGTNAGQAVLVGGNPITGLLGSKAIGTAFYFAGSNGLYKIATPPATAVEIVTTTNASITDAQNLVSFKNALYFKRQEVGDIWRVNASGKGELFLAEPSGYDFVYIVPGTAYLFFVANETRAGYKLWQWNGGTGTPAPLKDINNNPFYLENLEIQTAGTLFYFLAKTINTTLYQSDGTEANTKPVKDVNGGVFSGVTKMFPGGTKIHFVYDDGTHGQELWETAGTTLTTKLAKELNLYGDTIFGTGLLVGTKLYFLADNGLTDLYGYGKELWVK